jgi:hypothetical protein
MMKCGHNPRTVKSTLDGRENQTTDLFGFGSSFISPVALLSDFSTYSHRAPIAMMHYNTPKIGAVSRTGARRP